MLLKVNNILKRFLLSKFAMVSTLRKQSLWVVSRTYYKDIAGMKAFGERLREVRKSKGYSQEQLANECDLPLSQISRIETATINTSLSHICLIARVLKIKVSYLTDFDLK